MDQKKISVIVPCYNVELYIDRCVESLVNQTIGIDNLELILVDDASTDTTVECLKKWEKRYPDSVLLVCCSENHKQGAARNIGLCYASADYIAYVDSDDWVDPMMYEKMYARAEQYHPDVVSVLYSRDYQDGRVEMTADSKKNGEQYVEIRTAEERSRFLQEGLVGGVWSGIYRREMLQSDEGLFFPEDLRYEDNYWCAVLNMIVSSYYIINEPLYHYMINESSTIMEQNARHHLDRLVIELMKIEEYKRRGVFALYHDRIEFDFLRMYFINTIRILFVRFEQIPYEMIYTMQQQVLELFPDYENNPFLDTLPQLQSELLKIVKAPLDNAGIDILADAYRQILREYNRNNGI